MLIIIPARKGSKGLPGKNVKPFRGFPLVEWSFAAARHLACRLDAYIMCTTDDLSIVEMVEKYYGDSILIHHRSADLASDSAGMAGVVLDACAVKGFKQYVLLQPTSPLRLIADLDALAEATRNFDTVVSCTKPREHPRDLIAFDGQCGTPILNVPKAATRQAWSMECRFVDGAFYSGQVKTLLQTRAFEPPGTHYFTLGNPAAVDIDSPYDWALAEAQHDWLQAGGQQFVRPAH